VTECSPTIAQTRVESPRSDTSIGPPFPGVEIKLVGPRLAKQSPEGEAGEAMGAPDPKRDEGLLSRPLRKQPPLSDDEGWFNTRDLARLEDGNLFIVGRTQGLDSSAVAVECFMPAEVGSGIECHDPSQSFRVGSDWTLGGRENEEVIAFIQALAEYRADS